MKERLYELVAEWRATAKRYSDYATGMGLTEAMSQHFTDRANELEAALPVEWPRDMRESCERILHTNNDQLLLDTAKYVARVILERVDSLPVAKPGWSEADQ